MKRAGSVDERRRLAGVEAIRAALEGAAPIHLVLCKHDSNDPEVVEVLDRA